MVQKLLVGFILVIVLGLITSSLIFYFSTGEFPFSLWGESNLIRKYGHSPINSQRQFSQEIRQESPPKWPENSITLRDFYPARPGKILEGPAVLLEVKGGIGNQLFHYACLYSFARSHGWPLYIRLNLQEFQWKRGIENILRMKRTWGVKQRGFALDLFNIPLRDWNFIDASWNVTNPFVLTDAKLLSGEYPIGPYVYKLYPYDYCQSEVFFSKFKSEILDLFWPLEPPLADWVWEIQSVKESVAVHIRKGDYEKAYNKYGNVTFSNVLEFFRGSMDDIVKLLKTSPTFFLFSDDIAYVEEHLFSSHDDFLKYDVYIVSKPGVTTGIQELQLMSLCKHQIISFSTFSWWGAYLNRNPGKIVIAAKPPEKMIKNLYKGKEFYEWEFHHLYYPLDWRVKNPWAHNNETTITSLNNKTTII